MPSDSAASPNKRVVRMGKYEVIEHLATGGMAAVYRARDTQTGEEVALKVLPPEMAQKPALLERFRREARAAEKMRHENIVRVFDFDEHAGHHYLAMELVVGTDLHEYVKRKGTLPPEEARQIVLQAARALRHAADHNIVHRDIKPSNFLLSRKDGRVLVKLADFGLAREVDADEFRVTRAGTTVGTVDYMSPEQARDSSAADHRSDLYSLGCTWYQMLVGHAPFPKGGLGERLIRIINDPPPDARDLNPLVSDETWAILSKLLAKDPDQRYQEPGELIDALLTLDGKAAARPGEREAKRRPKKATRSRRPGSSSAAARAAGPTDEGRKLKRIILAMCAGAVVILGGLIWFLTRPPSEPPGENGGTGPGPIVQRPPNDKGKKPTTPPDKEKPPDKPIVKGPRWPALYRGVKDADVAALRKEVEAPFTAWKAPEAPFLATVRRSPGGAAQTYATLAEAVAAAPAGKAVVIEVADNGPLFTTGLSSAGRDVTVRAARGLRPLLVWDLPATLARRKQLKRDDQPLALFHVTGGRLEVEGLEVVCRWPTTLVEGGRLLDVSDGDLAVRSCTFSAAGKPRDGLTLARLRGSKEGRLARLTRCQARGAVLTALDLDAPGATILVDGCLLAGGAPPLLRLWGATSATKVSFVRSTLVGAGAMVELRPTERGGKAALSVLGWDALLCHAGTSEGDLLALRDGASGGEVGWRAINCLYAGWKNLLSGARSITGDDVASWRKQFNRIDGDDALSAPWPAQAPNEPATEPASSYRPDKAVGFASTLDADQPLGCDLPALPGCRDEWAELIEPGATVLDFPSDASAPDIPAPDDGKYHGGKVTIDDKFDLGAWLTSQQARPGLGPKVVLHLSGKGEQTTWPIRVKGSSLVLYFEPPDEKEKDAKPLVLRLLADKVAPLVEVTGGGLSVIGGTLRLPDARAATVSYGLSVQGGDLRLYRTRIEGPQQHEPEGYEAAIRFAGGGEGVEKPPVCLLNECVVLSSRAGLILDGPGARLGVRQSLVVSGTDGLRLLPGEKCKAKPAMQVTLDASTFACRRAVVYLGDARGVTVPAEPALVQANNCAYLNPFPSRPRAARAGLLLHEADALSRGLLLWQGEKEALDGRLYYGAWPANVTLPDTRPGITAWATLWGSGGQKERRPDLILFRELDANRWPLERLAIPMREPPGANLRKLGVGK